MVCVPFFTVKAIQVAKSHFYKVKCNENRIFFKHAIARLLLCVFLLDFFFLLFLLLLFVVRLQFVFIWLEKLL